MSTYIHSGIRENSDFFLSGNNHTYHMIPDDFQSGCIHYVDTEYCAPRILVPLLTFGLDFVLTSINHKSTIHTHVTTYSKYGKEILPTVLNTLQVSGTIPEFTMSHSESQRLVYQAFHFTEFKKLFNKHILIRADKNMETSVVSLF
jgi:hypothetical protein